MSERSESRRDERAGRAARRTTRSPTIDLVIEAVFEDLDVKKAVFAELDRVCKPGAVLATNTSYLDIDAIAASVSRPADVIGLHFFSPANIMKLLEVVVPAQVSADVVATAFELAKKLRKVPVRAGVCDGFIGNRVLAVYRAAADHMMEDGASPYQIDRAVREFGFPMGPFQVADLAGGDIGWAARKRRAADPRPRSALRADRRPSLRARLVRAEDGTRVLPLSRRRTHRHARPRSRGDRRRRTRSAPASRRAPSPTTRSCAATWPR